MDIAGMTEDQTAALAHLVEALSGAHVAVLGDVMLDRYVDGAVDRISPEAPIPVLAIRAETEVPGGAGNVARNLAALGAHSTLIGVIGADEEGTGLEGLLAREGGLTCRLHRLDDRPTPVKTRFMAGGHQLLRTDRERTGPVAETTALALLETLEAALGAGARIVVLSDYGKGTLSDAVLAGAIRLAGEHGARVIVDPKGSDYRRYAGADFVTPNRKELSLATGLPTGSDEEVIAACAALTASSGVRAVLATRSEQGMTLALPGRAPVHLPAEAREVFDVAGAGDTVVAALAAGLAVGAEPALAAALANAAAGIVVAKRGTAVALPGEILAALEAAAASADGVAKVLSREGARARAEAWRARGLTVGFTNGCFDLLHPGHVSLLRQARASCDRLIVAINSDASVRRLKGETRPIQAEASRAAVLSALESVDAVTLFGEDTPLELIRLLRPDVLVKGADYTVETVVGAADVQSWGGRVVLAELVEGQSTTAIARRMAAP